MYSNFIKPLFDKLSALIGLLLVSPVFVIVVGLLYFLQNRQVFFIQKRPGYKEKIFKLIKFQTMRDATDSKGNPLPDEERLTKIGSFIRRTSLDELPQLINIIRGDMSFIGPRPWLVEYLNMYTDEQRKRHDVKPGISGWAQVNGRNLVSWDERFTHDLYYVKNQSFLLDLKILILTVKKVFRAEGVSAEGHATMEKFKGKSNQST